MVGSTIQLIAEILLLTFLDAPSIHHNTRIGITFFSSIITRLIDEGETTVLCCFSIHFFQQGYELIEGEVEGKTVLYTQTQGND